MGVRLSDSPQPRALESGIVAVGGAIGACLRHAVGLPLRALLSDSLFAALAATCCVNLLGAALLGALLAWLESHSAHPLLQPFLGVGVLGAFTTWSALLLDGQRAAASLGPVAGTIWILVSLALGLGAFELGRRACER